MSDSSASWGEFKRLAEDLGAGIVEIPPTEYEASVTAAFDEKRNVVLDVIANGPPIAEVRRTSKGLLWVSVFQGVAARDLEPGTAAVVSRIVRDRRRWDPDDGFGALLALRPCVHLLDHPEFPADERLLACGPNDAKGNHEVDPAKVLSEARTAVANGKRGNLVIR